MSEIGQRIKALRARKGWTLREMSERTGISYSMIGHIETGTREGTASTLQKIAEAFSVSPSLLLDPAIDLDRLAVVSSILEKLQYLDDDQVAAVDHMIEALRPNR